MPDVAICIPSFKRPLGLERCLRSVEATTGATAIRVIVADNDSVGREAAEVCERLAAGGYRFPLAATVVKERGISHARNALVSEAIADPDIRFLAMIDDDEWATPGWLDELLRVQLVYAADIVGGPVMRRFEVPVPDHLAEANNYDFAAMKTGPIGLVDATSNILFRAAIFREKPAPWFDPQYALMGCEDVDVLLGFQMSGKVFAWASEAAVTEDMPRSRCSTKWMLMRAYRIGNTDTLVRRKHRPPGFGLGSETLKMVGAAGVAAANLVLFAWHPARRFKAALLGARAAGKLMAWLNIRHSEYTVVHGR